VIDSKDGSIVGTVDAIAPDGANAAVEQGATDGEGHLYFAVANQHHIAVVDATVEARWDRAAASLGHHAPWNGGKEAQGSTEVFVPESEREPDDWPEPDAPAQTAAHQAAHDVAQEEGQA